MKDLLIFCFVLFTKVVTVFGQAEYGVCEFQNYNYVKSFSKTKAIVLGENGQVGKWNGTQWRFKQHANIQNYFLQRGWFSDTNTGYVYLNNNPISNYGTDTSYVYKFINDEFRFAGFKKSGQIVSINFYNKDLGVVLLVDSIQRGNLYWFINGNWVRDSKFKCNILPPDRSDYIPRNLLQFTDSGELYVLTDKELHFWNKMTWNKVSAISGGHDIEFNRGKGYILKNNNVGNSTLYYFNGSQWVLSKAVNNAFKMAPFGLNDIWLIHCNSYSWSSNSTTQFLAHFQGAVVQNQFNGLFPEQTNWISMSDSSDGWVCGNNATLIKIEKSTPSNYSHRPSIKTLRDIKMGDLNNGICVGDSGTICIKKNGLWSLVNSSKINKSNMYYTCHYTDASEFLVAGKGGVFLYSKNGKLYSNQDLNFVNNLASFRSIQKLGGKYLLTSFDGLFEFDGISMSKVFKGSCYHSVVSADNTYYLDGQLTNADGSSMNGFAYLKNKELIQISGSLEYYYMNSSGLGKAWAGGRTFQLKPVIGWQEVTGGGYSHELVGDNGSIVLTKDGLNGFYILNSQVLFFLNNVQQLDTLSKSGGYLHLYNPRFNADKYNARKVFSACLADTTTAFVCGTHGLIFSYKKPDFKQSNQISINNTSRSIPIKIFPVPAHLNVFILNDLHGELDFEIYDYKGMKIKKGVITSMDRTISLEGLMNGVYFLVVGTNTIKLIKE